MRFDECFRQGRGASRVRLRELLAGAALLCASACAPDSQATRDWTAADHGQPAAGPSEGDGRAAPPAQEEGGPARAALALWNVSCASCHGRTGLGDGPTPPPGATLPNFALPAFQQARTDDQLAQTILAGRGMMPAFANKLSPKAVAALVAHIRTMAPAVAPAAPAVEEGG